MSARRRNPAVIASVSIAGAAFVILGTVLAFTPDGDELPTLEEVAATPTETDETSEPDPEPEPAPEPEPEPVTALVGEVVVEDLSVTGTGLYGSGHGADAAVPVDQAAVDDFRDALVAAIDTHLFDQQLGGTGTLVSDGPLRLADADRPVASATITLRIGVRGAPEWALADLDVVLVDGATEHTELVFEPGEPPLLLAVSE